MSIAEIQRKADAEFERGKKIVEATKIFTTYDWWMRKPVFQDFTQQFATIKAIE